MPTYETTDIAMINATPSRVFSALSDEYAGRTHWWTEVNSRQIGDIPFGQVGAVCAVEVRAHGITARFKWRTAEIIDDHYIRFEYHEGDIAGYADLRLEPEGEATRVEYHWRVKTRGKAHIFGPLFNLKKRHQEVMLSGFAKLDAYLSASRMPSASAHEHREQGQH